MKKTVQNRTLHRFKLKTKFLMVSGYSTLRARRNPIILY